jgi:hypothetical protein
MRDGSQVIFPVTLVLGDRNQRYVADEVHQQYSIYMDNWNDTQFAVSATRLAIQHLVSKERREQLVGEILRRTNRVTPIALGDLHPAGIR